MGSDEALSLWGRWFAEFGEPWVTDINGECYCCFCDGVYPDHESNCIYLAAKDLLTRTTVTPIPEFAGAYYD